jgi:hypothetical protein
MGTTVMHKGMTLARRLLPRAVWVHPFVSLLIAGVLLGGGLRFLSTSSASANAGPGSTSCTAK